MKALQSFKKNNNMLLYYKYVHMLSDMQFVRGRYIESALAIDLHAKAWLGDIYRKRNDAALGAKAYCKDQSGVPDTCYINLLTCKDLNQIYLDQIY
jgi:hypothetical protein